MAVERFKIRGMHCASCASTIEDAVRAIPGVEAAGVNFASETLTVTLAKQVSPDEVKARVASTGYEAIAEPAIAGAGESALDKIEARWNLAWVAAPAVMRRRSCY